MKKIFTILAAFFLVAASAQNSAVNSAESAPLIPNSPHAASPKAAWNLLFSHDITANGAGVGNAGVVLFDGNYWVSRWGSDTVFVIRPTGTVLSNFIISGVTGIRSMTTDGSFVYAGNNTSDIYKIDPSTKTLSATITVATVPNIRYCTYDPTADGNAGGFWVGTWATDFTLVDMSGNVVNSIPAGTHALTASYGLAFDGTSQAGPSLWSFHQTGTSFAADLIQVEISTGLQTLVMHDVTTDIGTAGDLGGGVHVDASTHTIFGILQGSPNLLFAYDLGPAAAIEAIEQVDFVSVYPNPAAQTVNIRIKRTNNDPMHIQIINSVGQVVSSSNNVGENNIYNIEKLNAGIYTVLLSYNGKTYSNKLVKE